MATTQPHYDANGKLITPAKKPPPPMTAAPAYTQGDLDNGVYGSWYTDPGPNGAPGQVATGVSPYQSDVPGWVHPAYSGTDAAYAAWLAGADQQAAGSASSAKLRKAQAEQAYNQALLDIQNEATNGRRNIQSSMLARGLFNSGETQRRGQEYDSSVTLSRNRAQAAETDQFANADDAQRTFLANLGMQGTEQVSQAMLRDSIAQYNAQQQAIAAQAAPQPVYQPQATQPTFAAPSVAPTFTPQVPAAPAYNPSTSSASLFKNQTKPPPAPAKAKPQQTKLVRSGLQ